VNLLHCSHVEVSEVFSGKRPTKNRFEWGNWATHTTGLPYLQGRAEQCLLPQNACDPIWSPHDLHR